MQPRCASGQVILLRRPGPSYNSSALKKLAVTKIDQSQFGLDLPATAEQGAFAADEMVNCIDCLRTNPPTRANCLYCGSPLPTKETKKQIPDRLPEEKTGALFHVVWLPASDSDVDNRNVEAVARLVGLTPGEVVRIARAGVCSPLKCAESWESAASLMESLRRLGIETTAIADHDLHLGEAPKQVQSLEVSQEFLHGIDRSQKLSLRWADVTLIIIGRLYFTTFEVEQRSKTNRKKIINEREFSSDEAVVDIYARTGEQNWRIRAANFDFSCLGEEKASTAFANFISLVKLLRERASHGEFDDSYGHLRTMLNLVWPTEASTLKTERRRSGGRQVHASVHRCDNEAEFTRYSRLLYALHLRQSEHSL